MLRADWFVAVAARPPLYNVLLQLPIDAATLEAQLKVDVPDDFRRNRLDRAGFLKSGVSEQNRLIERHDAAYSGRTGGVTTSRRPAKTAPTSSNPR